MTLIAACKSKSRIALLGDSASIGVDGSIASVSQPKVWEIESANMLLGYSGSFRFGQVLQYAYVLPDHPKKMPTFQYMATMFAESVHGICDIYGLSGQEESGGASGIGQLLICYRRCIFRMDYDFHIGEYDADFCAIGSGKDYALGALSVLDESLSPKKRLKRAGEATATHCTTVQGPFTVLSRKICKGA